MIGFHVPPDWPVERLLALLRAAPADVACEADAVVCRAGVEVVSLRRTPRYWLNLWVGPSSPDLLGVLEMLLAQAGIQPIVELPEPWEWVLPYLDDRLPEVRELAHRALSLLCEAYAAILGQPAGVATRLRAAAGAAFERLDDLVTRFA